MSDQAMIYGMYNLPWSPKSPLGKLSNWKISEQNEAPWSALMANVHLSPSHRSLFTSLISLSGLLLSISSSPWAVMWPEPCSADCLCSSMRGSHFRSPMTIPGGAAPPWLMLYKTFFTVVTFQGKQAGSELSICWVHQPVAPSSLTTISPSVTY